MRISAWAVLRIYDSARSYLTPARFVRHGARAEMAIGDWRSAPEFTYLDEADQADIAWEFLRRNAQYGESFHHIIAEVSSGPDRQDALAELAAHWGLRFPDDPDKGKL